MALFGTSNFSSAPRVLLSSEPLRGQVGENTVSYEQTVGTTVNHLSYTAFFFQTGTVKSYVYTGLDEAGAAALAAQLTKQDVLAVALGAHGTGMVYVKEARRASYRRVQGRMFEVAYTEEDRVVAEYNGGNS